MPKRRKDVIFFDAPPVISAWGSAGGKKEGEGPLASAFDYLTQDAAFADENCANWEQAESMLQQKAAGICLRKAGIAAKDVDLTFAGDLQAQCTASNYTLRTLATPFAGLYGACSTMTEALCLGAAFTAAGLGRQILAMTSSHFCAAERQVRTPLEYGAKRTTTAQWTATAAGACLVRAHGTGVPVRSVTFGRVQDYAVHDINNMGAAMAPAAYDTLNAHFRDTGRKPQDYDLIVTGDLGVLGKQIVLEQMKLDGFDLTGRYDDCGVMIFDPERQDVHAGGSGCGCSASVLCGHLLRRMREGKLKRLLFCATGALLSPVSSWQGESIPGVCHAVSIVSERR